MKNTRRMLLDLCDEAEITTRSLQNKTSLTEHDHMTLDTLSNSLLTLYGEAVQLDIFKAGDADQACELSPPEKLKSLGALVDTARNIVKVSAKPFDRWCHEEDNPSAEVEEVLEKHFDFDDFREINIDTVAATLLEKHLMPADRLKDLTWSKIAARLRVANSIKNKGGDGDYISKSDALEYFAPALTRKKLSAAIKNNKIRVKHPTPRRCNVHIQDVLAFIKESSSNSDNQIDIFKQYLDTRQVKEVLPWFSTLQKPQQSASLSRVCSANSRKWRRTCDHERMLGRGKQSPPFSTAPAIISFHSSG